MHACSLKMFSMTLHLAICYCSGPAMILDVPSNNYSNDVRKAGFANR